MQWAAGCYLFSQPNPLPTEIIIDIMKRPLTTITIMQIGMGTIGTVERAIRNGRVHIDGEQFHTMTLRDGSTAIWIDQPIKPKRKPEPRDPIPTTDTIYG